MDKQPLGGQSSESSLVFKLFAVIALVCTLVSLVAIILAAVSTTKAKQPVVTTQTGTGSQMMSGQTAGQMKPANTAAMPARKTPWLIALGHDWGAYEYIDNQGFLNGFSHMIIKAVCQAAEADCQTIWDPYTNCWQSVAGEHSRGGPGLFGRWYDACTGWSPSVGRIHVFRFTKSWKKPDIGAWYLKPGSNFNTNDLSVSSGVIGFLDGWVHDEKCLARENQKGTPLPRNRIQHFATPAAVKVALLNGQIEAAFSEDLLFHDEVRNNEIKKVVDDKSCVLSGNAMMTRKDSTFVDMWNRGFDKIMANGEYRRICQEAAATHADRGTIACLNS